MTQVSLDERVSSMRRLCDMALECCDTPQALREEKLELLRLGMQLVGKTEELPLRAVFAHYEGLIEQRLREMGAA